MTAPTRQRWTYQGRGDVAAVDSYIWHATVTLPDTNLTETVACAIPVNEFWPTTPGATA